MLQLWGQSWLQIAVKGQVMSALSSFVPSHLNMSQTVRVLLSCTVAHQAEVVCWYACTDPQCLAHSTRGGVDVRQHISYLGKPNQKPRQQKEHVQYTSWTPQVGSVV